MEPRSVEFSATINFWGHFRATRAVTNRLTSNYAAWVFFVGVPLLIAVAFVILGRDFSEPTIFNLPMWMGLAGGPLFVLVLMPLIQMLNVSGMRRSSTAGDVQTYAIDDNGFAVRGGSFDTTLKWSAFLKAIETKEFFLLYVSARWAHFIPKAAVKSEDLQTIRMILRGQLGRKARLFD